MANFRLRLPSFFLRMSSLSLLLLAALAPLSPTAPAKAQPSYGEIPDYQLQYDVPDSATIPYQQAGREKLVDVLINDHPIKMVFDTGAGNTVLGKNHLALLGIDPPQGESEFKAQGVGESDNENDTKAWHMIVDLQVGNVRFRKFRITVMENMPTEPLLGRSFSGEFRNNIDTDAKTIILTKKKATNASYRSATSVPFKTRGSHLIVEGQVNGSPCSMIFDTGAAVTLFSTSQFKQLGLTVPYDAKETTVTGISGTTPAKKVPIPSIRLGPITKNDFVVYVTEKEFDTCPLIGQDFFGDWNFSIDQADEQIEFQQR